MAKIKVGDKVTVKKSTDHEFYQNCDCAQADYLILTGFPSQNGNSGFQWDGYYKDGKRFSSCSGHNVLEKHFVLLKGNKTSNMSLKSIYKNLTRQEPEKSFVKAGITDESDSLTSDGTELFIEWLFEKNKADFNTEVVQPILKEQEEEK